MPVERAKRGKVLIIKDVGSLIITIRNQKVIVDRDLAEIYGVETRRLNEQVKRNPERFPEDFMFQLTKEEADFWLRSRSQIAILKRGKNIKYLPYAFTEHGAIMAANVLNSPQAVKMKRCLSFGPLSSFAKCWQRIGSWLTNWLSWRENYKTMMNRSDPWWLPYGKFTPLEITSHVLYLCNTKQEGQTVLYRIYRRSAEPPPRARCR